MPASSSTIKIAGAMDKEDPRLRLRGDRRRMNFCDGNADYKSRANRKIIFYSNRAIVLRNYAGSNGQAKSCSAILGGKMREEQPVLIFRRNSVAGVFHNNFKHFALNIGARAKRDLFGRRAIERIRGIVDQIYQHTAQKFRVALYLGKLVSEFGANGDVIEALVKNFERGFDNSVRIDRGHARHRET